MENAEATPAAEIGGPGPPTEASDAALLRRFVTKRDEAAFAALVERYGPLVLGVCARVLDHRQDAEDALQTTFLVLARKAGSITRRECLCSWIYRVAYRIALKARGARARRLARETRLAEVAAADRTPEWFWRDLRPILDEEVNRLPLKYRLPFILCYLEGKTNAQAAGALKCPPGTVMSRLAWARERLRGRLEKRGVVLSTGLLAAVLAEHATASALPTVLANPTVANALRFAAGQAGAVTARVAAPAQEFLRGMFLTQLARTVALLLAMGGVAGLIVWLLVSSTGIGRPGNRTLQPRPAPVRPADHAKLQGIWSPERIEVGGQAVPGGGLKLAFTGDSFQLITADGAMLTMRFEIDPNMQPAAFTLYRGREVFGRGVYRLDGDALAICYATAGEPPREFDSSHSPQTVLYRAKRDDPTPGEPKP